MMKKRGIRDRESGIREKGSAEKQSVLICVICGPTLFINVSFKEGRNPGFQGKNGTRGSVDYAFVSSLSDSSSFEALLAASFEVFFAAAGDSIFFL